MHSHPTPVHIRTCVTDAICEEMTKRGEYVPTWVLQAVKDGIARACAEHDRDTNARAAA